MREHMLGVDMGEPAAALGVAVRWFGEGLPLPRRSAAVVTGIARMPGLRGDTASAQGDTSIDAPPGPIPAAARPGSTASSYLRLAPHPSSTSPTPSAA